MNLTELKAKLQALLQGEPLRAIVYGSAVVVWLVTHVAAALHVGNLQVVDMDGALAAATAAAALLTELARRYVYSPATVSQIVTELTDDAVTASVTPEDTTPADDAPAADAPAGDDTADT